MKRKTNYYKVNESLNPLSKFCNWYFNRKFIARIIALISVLNLIVVAFDITYIPLRDVWLNGKITVGKFKIGPYEYQGLPLIVVPESWRKNIIKYDAVKGIVPYRDTAHYLEEVDNLQKAINQFGLNSPESEEILNLLRERSTNMIDEDPFKLANKSGSLEKLKNRMVEHMDQYINNPQESSKLAFIAFWTVKHLQDKTEQELAFFNDEIKPLINTNYYRPIDETGYFTDYFGLIDFPFILVIFVDFIIRCYAISSRYHGVNFRDAILWRWYDLIFFLPTWRWLRIIPVTIRLDEAKLLNSKSVRKQASQGFVAGIAGDITEVVVLRIINQIQNLIQQGQIEKLLSLQANNQEYIDLNDTNEVVEISKLLINLVTCQVLPEIRPEVENLLAYTIEKGISEAPAYQNVRNLPGFNQFPRNISTRISNQVYQVLLDSIDTILRDDPLFDKYLSKILEKLIQTVNLRIGARQDINQIEGLLVALLEEVKVNYVQKLSEEDIEALLDETRALKENKSPNFNFKSS